MEHQLFLKHFLEPSWAAEHKHLSYRDNPCRCLSLLIEEFNDGIKSNGKVIVLDLRTLLSIMQEKEPPSDPTNWLLGRMEEQVCEQLEADTQTAVCHRSACSSHIYAHTNQLFFF